MSRPAASSHRAFVHLELNTDDVAASRDFYASVLGWDFEDVPVSDGTYTRIATPSGPAGGIQRRPTRAMAPAWLPYVAVADVEDVVERAREAGGRVIADVNVVPGYGALAIVEDPTGAVFGVWTAEEEPQAHEDASPTADISVNPSSAPRKKAPPRTPSATASAAKQGAPKTPGKKSPGKKTPARKKSTSKASGKKTPEPVEKPSAKKTSAKKASAKKTSAKRTSGSTTAKSRTTR